MSCRVCNVGVNRLRTFTPKVFSPRPLCFSSFRHNSSLSCKDNGEEDAPAATNSTRYTYNLKGYGSHAPPRRGTVPVWTETLFREVEVPPSRQIFCNRALNMRDIKAVGFDMDYTLAQYLPQTFEQRAYREAQRRLVRRFGYPEEVERFNFEWDYMTKGLIVDKVLGNVLKVDRHNYVKVAYHGFKELSSDERKFIYRDSQRSSEVFSDTGYAMVDTLFSLAEAYLFMQLVELKDSGKHAFLDRKGYREMYKDLRVAVDMCHRDGSLKRAVAAEPGRYMHTDPHLKEMLETLRQSGRRVFLATNSLWDYTNVVMNFMIYGKTGSSRDLSWLSLFDVVLVGCAKPGFFNHRAPLFKIDVDTGLLRNTDNGAPVIPIDVEDIPSQVLAGGSLAAAEGGKQGAAAAALGSGDLTWTLDPKQRVFQGGCFVDLHNMLGVQSGSEILYAGDHIYGDILKSKRAVGWRTMLVVPELELELELLHKNRHTMAGLRRLRRLRDDLDDKIQRLRRGLAVEGDEALPASEADALRPLLERLEAERARVKARQSKELRAHHTRFHPVWGQVMKTGYQNSRFAHQVERYACLYTSHVANLAFVSPDRSFAGRMDYLAHELEE